MSEKFLTVTALNRYLNEKFVRDPYLQKVVLMGEISNFRQRPTHQYFSLKDEGSVINATMFQGAFQKVDFNVEEGMKVVVTGRVSMYAPQGKYQIIIERMEPLGVGALYQKLEERKKRLFEEGLFQESLKQPIVSFPKRIAVLTSESGAVIQDIMTTVKRRFPIVQLVLFPTIVQGEKSKDSIVQNIQKANEMGNFDTLILARGGGSIEDLWSFNEEEVVRAIVASKIPVISSVGHETDTTLSDLASDLRAATPTAAAELATPRYSDLLYAIHQQSTRLTLSMERKIEQERIQLKKWRSSYIYQEPQRLYDGYLEKVDRMKERLRLQSPSKNIVLSQERKKDLEKQLSIAIRRLIEKNRLHFQTQVSSLDHLSPLKVLGRGYTIVRKEKKVVKSIAEFKTNEKLELHFSDGRAEVVVEKKRKEK